MDDWLKKPWVIRVISLALAVLLFAAVTFDDEGYQSDVGFDSFLSSSNETRNIEDMPVNVKIDQEKYVVSGVPQTVSVELEGSVSAVTSTATQKNFDVFVDLQGLKSGTYTVPLQYTGISDSLNVYIEPKEVEVIIEEKATKEFNVTVDYLNQNQMEAGYELGEATVNPSKVAITSSKSRVDKIAIVKAFVDVQEVDEPIESRDVPVKVYDNQGNELNVRIEPSMVEVSVDVKNPNKVVPIEVKTKGEAPEDITIKSVKAEPEEALVFASEEILTGIDSLVTEEIDLSKITEETTVDVELQAPSDIRKLEPKQVTVTIEVEKAVEETFENIPIDIINLDNDLTLNFINPNNNEMSITVTGSETEISNLSMEDFQLTINVEDRGLGEHEIPIEIEGPEDITIDSEFNHATVQIE